MNLGQLLIAAGVLTQHELRTALRYQDEHPEMTLGSVILFLGYASHEAIEKAVMQHSLMEKPGQRIDPDKVLELIDQVTVRQRDLVVSTEFLAQMLKNRT